MAAQAILAASTIYSSVTVNCHPACLDERLISRRRHGFCACLLSVESSSPEREKQNESLPYHKVNQL